MDCKDKYGPHIYTQAHGYIQSGKDEFVSMSGTVEICTTCYGRLILQVVLANAALVTFV